MTARQQPANPARAFKRANAAPAGLATANHANASRNLKRVRFCAAVAWWVYFEVSFIGDLLRFYA